MGGIYLQRMAIVQNFERGKFLLLQGILCITQCQATYFERENFISWSQSTKSANPLYAITKSPNDNSGC